MEGSWFNVAPIVESSPVEWNPKEHMIACPGCGKLKRVLTNRRGKVLVPLGGFACTSCTQNLSVEELQSHVDQQIHGGAHK